MEQEPNQQVMPSREQMIADLVSFRSGRSPASISQEAPEENVMPSREQMISDLIARGFRPEPSLDKQVQQISQKQKQKQSLKALEQVPAPAPASVPNPEQIEEPVAPAIMPTMLGSLSAKYESGARASSAIGYDSKGGVSFGTYQISEGKGTLKRFLSYLKDNNKEIYNRLAPLRRSANKIDGAFAKEWAKIAESPKTKEAMSAAQHDFIKITHYDVANALLKRKGVDLDKRSDALHQVLWSISVQHGPERADDIFLKIKNFDERPDSEIIKRVFPIRKLYLGKLTEEEKQSVLLRYRQEQTDALKMLESKQGKNKIAEGKKYGKGSRG